MKIIVEKKPAISVIMPVYNTADFLSEAIESILTQTFGDFELIIIDDGSIDRSWEIIRGFVEQDERIRVFHNELNSGICYTRNLGLHMATGNYIAVMDSDDISIPERFEKQITYLESHPDIDVLGGQIVKFSVSGHLERKSNCPLTPGGVRWSLLSGCQIAHSTIMMRRRLISVEGFIYRNFKVAHDYDLWTRLAPGHKITNLPDVLVKYRIHQTNISKTQDQVMKDEAFSIVQSYAREVSGECLPDEIIKGLIITKDIASIEQAVLVSNFLLKLKKLTNSWDLNRQEKSEISHQAAYKLHSICEHFRYNPRLFTVLLTAYFLESRAKLFRQKSENEFT